ncbi:T9SS type A sorting domain-containing protein [Crocinitomicaceae bacterium]|nr:T9SS type A sorting domain-containing protein [Crocinitomicaceae bacterium]
MMHCKLAKILFLVVSMSIKFSFGQGILSDFDIDVNQGKVLLSWTIKSGSTCNGIQIYRSTFNDSTGFDIIEDIQGVCGDLSAPVTYTYTDQSPTLNTVNYYKLHLGGQEYSQVLSIEVVQIPSNSYLLRPNPISGTADLLFENANNENIELKIYDDFGSIIHKEQTNGNRFILDSNSISSGLYYFTIKNQANNKIINGRALFLD